MIKSPGVAAIKKLKNSDTIKILRIEDGKFIDDRWVDGQWDIDQFKNINGKIDWDSVSFPLFNLIIMEI